MFKMSIVIFSSPNFQNLFVLRKSLYLLYILWWLPKVGKGANVTLMKHSLLF